MTIPRITRQLTAQLGSTDTAYRTMLTTPWMLLVGSDSLRVTTSIEARSGGYRHPARYRTADVSTRFPSAWTDSSNVRSTEDCWAEDFSSITAGPLWVQAGLAVSSSSGAGEALASLQASTSSAGQIVAARTLQIEPTLNSGAAAYIPLGRWVPQLGVTGVTWAIWATGVTGTLSVRAAGRVCDRPELPGSWVDFGSDDTDITTDGAAPNLVYTVTDGGGAFIQPALKIHSVARGTLNVLVAMKF